eukprot:gene8971-6294_t
MLPPAVSQLHSALIPWVAQRYTAGREPRLCVGLPTTPPLLGLTQLHYTTAARLKDDTANLHVSSMGPMRRNIRFPGAGATPSLSDGRAAQCPVLPAAGVSLDAAPWVAQRLTRESGLLRVTAALPPWAVGVVCRPRSHVCCSACVVPAPLLHLLHVNHPVLFLLSFLSLGFEDWWCERAHPVPLRDTSSQPPAPLTPAPAPAAADLMMSDEIAISDPPGGGGGGVPYASTCCHQRSVSCTRPLFRGLRSVTPLGESHGCASACPQLRPLLGGHLTQLHYTTAARLKDDTANLHVSSMGPMRRNIRFPGAGATPSLSDGRAAQCPVLPAAVMQLRGVAQRLTRESGLLRVTAALPPWAVGVVCRPRSHVCCSACVVPAPLLHLLHVNHPVLFLLFFLFFGGLRIGGARGPILCPCATRGTSQLDRVPSQWMMQCNASSQPPAPLTPAPAPAAADLMMSDEIAISDPPEGASRMHRHAATSGQSAALGPYSVGCAALHRWERATAVRRPAHNSAPAGATTQLHYTTAARLKDDTANLHVSSMGPMRRNIRFPGAGATPSLSDGRAAQCPVLPAAGVSLDAAPWVAQRLMRESGLLRVTAALPPWAVGVVCRPRSHVCCSACVVPAPLLHLLHVNHPVLFLLFFLFFGGLRIGGARGPILCPCATRGTSQLDRVPSQWMMQCNASRPLTPAPAPAAADLMMSDEIAISDPPEEEGASRMHRHAATSGQSAALGPYSVGCAALHRWERATAVRRPAHNSAPAGATSQLHYTTAARLKDDTANLHVSSMGPMRRNIRFPGAGATPSLSDGRAAQCPVLPAAVMQLRGVAQRLMRESGLLRVTAALPPWAVGVVCRPRSHVCCSACVVPAPLLHLLHVNHPVLFLLFFSFLWGFEDWWCERAHPVPLRDTSGPSSQLPAARSPLTPAPAPAAADLMMSDEIAISDPPVTRTTQPAEKT